MDLTDEDGDDSALLELSNISGSAIDLAGWHLSDAASPLDQREFLGVSLAPGEKLAVFASGTNPLFTPSAPVQCNFTPSLPKAIAYESAS